jgi:uncharacterized protein
MIIEFSIGNYRSFNGIQTINFRATGLKSENEEVDTNNIAEVDGQRLLKTIGVYGANASGKSNLINGINDFRRIVISSLERFSSVERIMNPFKQSSEIKDHSGFFQTVIFLEGKRYRYGFTLSPEGIGSEWLFGPAGKNETYYFTRKGKEIKINEIFSEGLNIPYETKLRNDTLFLSFCAAYNGETTNKIRNFFDKKMSWLALEPEGQYVYNNVQTNTLVAEGKKELVLNWLNEAGLYFNDVNIENMGEKEYYSRDGEIMHDFNEGDVKLHKEVYDTEGKIAGKVLMDLSIDESEGTRKYYSFIGKLHEKFEKGGLFISDEIDSNFHPLLLQKIISLFNNPGINRANAQLLFTSHDTNLMNPQIMRRDQFYFTEKSVKDETILYSLSDLKGIRNNADFARQYLAGYYGSIPILGNFLEIENSKVNSEI